MSGNSVVSSSIDEFDYDDDESSDEEKEQRRETGRFSSTQKKDESGYSLFTNQEDFAEVLNLDLVGESENETNPKENLWRPIEDLGLSNLDMNSAVEVATVLEELSDKLNVIGNSIDTPPIDIRQKRSVISDMTLHRPQLHIPPIPDLTQYDSLIQLRLHGIRKSTKKGKIQADRTDTQVAVDIAVAELVQNFSFQHFVDAVAQKAAVYEEMDAMVETSSANAERMVQLKHQYKQVGRDKVSELASMEHDIYVVHDGTQEMIRRKEMEGSYVRKCGSLLRKRSEKTCHKYESKVETELTDMRMTVLEEDRTHESMVEIIQAKFAETEERLDYWMDKYESDKETLQNELDTMKANRERDLKRIAWLKHMIYNYSQICRDDRRINDKMAEEERIFRLKIKKTIIIQAWWRGELVRKELGPFRPVKPGKKKGKGKKGKKGK